MPKCTSEHIHTGGQMLPTFVSSAIRSMHAFIHRNISPPLFTSQHVLSLVWRNGATKTTKETELWERLEGAHTCHFTEHSPSPSCMTTPVSTCQTRSGASGLGEFRALQKPFCYRPSGLVTAISSPDLHSPILCNQRTREAEKKGFKKKKKLPFPPGKCSPLR